MFLGFFTTLRDEGLRLSPREFLTFLDGLSKGLAGFDILALYHFGRTALVKDERYFDRYDRAFARCFGDLDAIDPSKALEQMGVPEDWLRVDALRHLSPEERAEIQALGGFDALMDTLRQRLAEQKERHSGGNKWIGTGGTSPFGAYGYNPEGVRIGQKDSRHQRAVKVWDQRAFRNLDGAAALSPRNMKLALRALRRWAREGAQDELDLDATIHESAAQGWLDVRTRAPRRNAVKIALFMDVGGSMDAHIAEVEALFSAAKSEFRTLELWYFHNCLYEGLWRDNHRRHDQQTPTWDVLRRLGPEWRAIFVGDAAMSPYEISHAGGAVEHWNAESGATWLARATAHWPHHLWINPTPKDHWRYSQSTQMIAQFFPDRMVPMTLDGLGKGVKILR